MYHITVILIFILTIYYWLIQWLICFERFTKCTVYLLPMMWLTVQIQAHWNDRQHDWHKTNGSSEQSGKMLTEHGPHSSTLVCICVVRLLFVLFYVLFVCRCVLPPGDNPTAVNKYINTHMHTSTLASVTMLYCRRLSTFRNLFLSIHEATCHKAKP